MATEILAGQLGDLRSYSTAAGGTALSTTSVFIPFPANAYHLIATPRNFSTAVVAKMALCPHLVVLKTLDGMATAPVDYTSAANDADAGTDIVVSALDTLANGDFLLVGSYSQYRGVYIDVDSTNTNSAGTATTSVFYNASKVWTDTSAMDGTNSTMTFAVDGLVYWTLPTAWTLATLKELYPQTPDSKYSDLKMYWTRWSVSAALADTSITFNSMLAANRSQLYSEWISGQVLEERITTGLGGWSGLEALTDAGTANLIVNVATVQGGKF